MSPIPLRELQRRAKVRHPRPDTLPSRLLTVLQADREQAWRAVELARKCRADIHSVGSALRRLRARGLIEKMEEHWYALDDQEVAQWQAMVITTRLANERLGREDPKDWPAVDLPARRRSRGLGKRKRPRRDP